MNIIPSDIALEVARTAFKMCAAIRRDHGWTKSDDSPAHHRFILRDLETTCVPRCEPHIARLINDAIECERQAWRQRYGNI